MSAKRGKSLTANQRSERWLVGYLVVVFLVMAGSGHALVIRSYNPSVHDRFISGYPAAPVANTNLHAAYFDFSGVGWYAGDPNLSCTLISPSHFVGANHVRPGVGSTVAFQGGDGGLRSFTVARTFGITNSAGQNSDLFVGELDRAVVPCDCITCYPILDLPTEAAYVGQSLLIYGRLARVGKGVIGQFQDFGGDPITGGAGINSTRTYGINYANAAGSADDAHGEGGDSGSPSFIAVNGELFIVGVHSAIISSSLGTVTSDSFIPNYLDQVKRILQMRGYQAATGAASVFRLCYDLTPRGDNVYQLEWTGHPGRIYQVESATNLFQFTPVSGLLTATVAKVTFIHSNSVQRATAYRIRRIDYP